MFQVVHCSLMVFYMSTELAECIVQLPTFIDPNYKISQSLSPRGVMACERVIAVIAYSHPAITYAPSLYAITSLLLHYMDGEWRSLSVTVN